MFAPSQSAHSFHIFVPFVRASIPIFSLSLIRLSSELEFARSWQAHRNSNHGCGGNHNTARKRKYSGVKWFCYSAGGCSCCERKVTQRLNNVPVGQVLWNKRANLLFVYSICVCAIGVFKFQIVALDRRRSSLKCIIAYPTNFLIALESARRATGRARPVYARVFMRAFSLE